MIKVVFVFLLAGDFGIAKSLHETIDVASTCVGTPCYLSPEMCQDIPYSSKADVWVGVSLIYLGIHLFVIRIMQYQEKKIKNK